MATDSQSMSVFSDDAQAVIERVITVRSEKHSVSEITDVYEIERTVQLIFQGDYRQIALQFPDELLADSAMVAGELRERTERNVYILADTSYGSCCVDEIAAEHTNADVIIHYGRSCLSPTLRLPVIYVFGKQPIDIEHCAATFTTLLRDFQSQPMIFMYDVMYAHAADAIVESLRTTHNFTNIIPTYVSTESNLQRIIDNDTDTLVQPLPLAETACNDPLCSRKNSCTSGITHKNMSRSGRNYGLPDGVKVEDCAIIYVGEESLTLTNILMTHSQCKVYTYNPKTKIGRQETLAVNKMLMKRYFLVQKAKDADVIGIVVGTLGVASYLTIIDHLRRLIQKAGKKPYTFVMGKLNVAKMANFMEIDCYVLVACPENSLIDSKEFYRPIVTPFELEIALVKSKEWTTEYITDFQQLLPGMRSLEDSLDRNEAATQSSDDEPDFSLVTGKYKQNKKYATSKAAEDALISGVTDLTLRNKENSISIIMNSPASDFLNSRSYRGLEQAIGEREVEFATEGRSGTARGYTTEKAMNISKEASVAIKEKLIENAENEDEEQRGIDEIGLLL